MYDVVLVKSAAQEFVCPETECKWFGKAHRGNTKPFHEIYGIAELPQGWYAEWVLRVIEIKAGKSKNGDPIIQHRIRRTGDHLHMMPKVFQGPAQVLEIDPLTAAVGVAPVTQQADSKGG